jgi:hypothetical protein
MKKGFLLALGGTLLFTGCCNKPELTGGDNSNNLPKTQNVAANKPIIRTVKYNNQVCLIKNDMKKSCVIKLEAKGVGVVPCDGACSKPEAVAMARRAAILDAYKALAEKMYGIKINGRDTVKNMILQSSTLKAYVDGLIRGADIEDESFKNGIYTVTMNVKIDVNEWNKFLQNR